MMETRDAHRADAPPAPRGSGFRVCVLVVDDVPANLLAFEGMLRRDDIEIVTARSGALALEILLERDVALAIIDVQMPDMNGFELATLMRGVEKTRYVPIIFVTANASNDARVFQGYEAGAVDYLLKPVEERVLRSKVDVFVTLERHRRELVDAEHMREMYIAVLGHDLRNPLNGILMAAQLAREETAGNAEAADLLERIVRNGRRMGRMIDQVLDTTRFRIGGGVLLTPARADLRELTEQVLGELEQARDRFRVEVVGDTHGVWDVDRVLQILSNLVGNAVRHAPYDSPISISVDGSRDDSVTFRVSNGGPPIPDDVRDLLFEPFRRANEIRHSKEEGLGLGLYITKELVLAHRGTVTFESKEGSGTTFLVRLPRETPAASSERAHAGPPNGGASPTASSPEKTILIVDDDRVARLALRDLLDDSGYRAVTAGRPSEALAVASEHGASIDLLLTDIRLPEMGGDELADRLRALHPGLEVIFVSGLDAGPPGTSRFLQKPIDIDELLEAIEETLA